MKHRTRDEHLFEPGPKRILALDGGGIRGILTLSYLERIEAILRDRAGGDPDFTLSDYFDLIGGTSTGSIIAAGLAMGFPVARIQQLYRNLANEVFKRPIWRLGIFSSKFPREPLELALQDQFGDTTLGSDDLRTGLMIMTKRLDTGSPWVLHNNPRGKYFSPRPGRPTLPNRDFLLRQIVRASTAAPHFFEPERLMIAPGLEGAFVDGGVSPANNPALQLFMLATMDKFAFKWPVGADELLLVSVGTGAQVARMTADEVLGMPALQLAGQSLLSLMADADWLGQTMLQWMSRSPTSWIIDAEIGDLQDDLLGGQEMLSYLRYNVLFDRTWIKENLGLDLTQEEVNALPPMDNPQNVSVLADVGAKAAATQVKEEHFPAAFDLPG